MKRLEPATTYAFRVRASNAAGAGDWSPVVCVTTAATAPSEPLALACRPLSANIIELAWQPPAAEHGAPVVAYQVRCERDILLRVRP